MMGSFKFCTLQKWHPLFLPQGSVYVNNAYFGAQCM